MKVLRTFKQQTWNPQLDVAIVEGGAVTVDSLPVKGERETALANIILKLNGHGIIEERAKAERIKDLKEYIKVLEETIDGSIGMAEVHHEYLDCGEDLKELRKRLGVQTSTE